MCVFTGSVSAMSSTAIFARPCDRGRQVLVYRMALITRTEVAMVLPLPVPPGSADNAVQFIDLSDYPEFFDDLDLAFPPEVTSLGQEMRQSMGAHLVVHDVGFFEASFVPTRRDFSRLDQRFRLPDDVWQALPGYDDWGFAVFKLKSMARRTDVHPMAFDFPQRNPDRLFCPTVHVHNGRVEPWATFDHQLYCQDVDETRLDRWCGSFQSKSPWKQSSVALSEVLDADRAGGIARLDRPCHRVPISGSYANVDVVI
jgi:hypothetical protein